MHLARLRLVGLRPFDDLVVPLIADDAGEPRLVTVIFGEDGLGKTDLLAAIASTRPGHAVAQAKVGDEAPAVLADWHLGDDDPGRPHPLRIVNPNAALEEPAEVALIRRREQALFEKRALESGFVLVSFSGARWFSRTPLLLTTPERTVLRYDVRGPASFDDATRADLTRETKQVLSFVTIAAALERRSSSGRFARLERALAEVLEVLLEPFGCRYAGVPAGELEPAFEVADSRSVGFDDLARSAKHVVAFGALTLRALAAAYPEAHDPRQAQGVALLDDAEAQQPVRVQRILPQLLARALPRVQWLVTTSSPDVTLGCAASEVLALRRDAEDDRIDLFEGPDAVMH